jgi:D-alanyl-lipoteichoic acid acyltransferase DltB (MBOAT superfamily)
MLFNSYTFILVFLPCVVLGFMAAGRIAGSRGAIAWLVLASLFFYGYWNPIYLWLIAGTILFNFAAGRALDRWRSRALLGFAIAANLTLLGYFKYANFFIDTLNDATGAGIDLAPIVLPLGISFFTFQKIAYLVDSYRGLNPKHNLLHYSMFVTFFPQLIAGPIVHPSEILPQVVGKARMFVTAENLAVGVTIFIMGLTKKVAIADRVSEYANTIFDAAAAGTAPSLADAWVGALAYTFQLYFDFSGYSDMAIGLARIFGIILPLNFNSPYKSANIIEFWRRWHMTLSRFLRDYLYIPLGGNRKGEARRYVNLMITMLLGGFWHGAAWTFIFWGGLHGIFLCINNLWRTIRKDAGPVSQPGHTAATLLTFICIVIAWVFFRAKSFAAAIAVLRGMAGLEGVSFATQFDYQAFVWVAALLPAVWFLPNVQQVMADTKPVLDWDAIEKRFTPTPAFLRWIRWQPRPQLAFTLAVLAFWLLTEMDRVKEFLYYQF